MSMAMDVYNAYAPQLSVLDQPLYNGKVIGTGTTVKLQFFTDTIASVGEQLTNLDTAGYLPSNWPYFVVDGIGLKFSDTTPLATADINKFLANSTYVYKRAGATIKWGRLGEFANRVGTFSMTPTVASSTTLANADFPGIKKSIVPLKVKDVIKSGDAFSFTVLYSAASGVSSFTNTRLYVFFFGELNKKLAG